MVRLEKNLEATILLSLRLASPSFSPLICLFCGTIIPCDCDYHLDCNPFINFSNAPFPGLPRPLLQLQVAEIAREPTLSRLLLQQHKLASRNRIFIPIDSATKPGRQYPTAANTRARSNRRTQALNCRHPISTTGLSPLQNSSYCLPNRPGLPGRERASLGPVQRLSPANNQHFVRLVLHLRPHQAHLQKPKPHAQPERSIFLQLLYNKRDQEHEHAQEQERDREREPEPQFKGPSLVPTTRTPRPKGIEAVSTATGLFQRLHTLHQRTTIDQLNSPP